jgi:hypothetical protein
MRPLGFQFSMGGLFALTPWPIERALVLQVSLQVVLDQIIGPLLLPHSYRGILGTYFFSFHRASIWFYGQRDSYGSRHPTGGSRPLESPLLTPRFSPLKILRVKSQHALFWLAF